MFVGLKMVVPLLAVLLTMPAVAQDAIVALNPTSMTGWAGGEAARAQLERRARGGAVGGLSTSARLRSELTAPSQSTPAVASLPYRSSPTVRAKVVDIFLTNGPKNPAYVNEVKQFIGSGAVFREYGRFAPQLGLRLNDAVDAYAFYLLAQWVVANDYRPDPTRAQVAGVRAQAARTLADVAPALRAPAARQEFAETLIAQGVIMASAHGTAQQRGDERTMRTLAAQARRGGVVVFNMDPTRIALTNSGFRLRGRADAGGVAGEGGGTEAIGVADAGTTADPAPGTDAGASAFLAETDSGADNRRGGAVPAVMAGAALLGLGLWATRGKRRLAHSQDVAPKA